VGGRQRKSVKSKDCGRPFRNLPTLFATERSTRNPRPNRQRPISRWRLRAEVSAAAAAAATRHVLFQDGGGEVSGGVGFSVAAEQFSFNRILTI